MHEEVEEKKEKKGFNLAHATKHNLCMFWMLVLDEFLLVFFVFKNLFLKYIRRRVLKSYNKNNTIFNVLPILHLILSCLYAVVISIIIGLLHL